MFIEPARSGRQEKRTFPHAPSCRWSAPPVDVCIELLIDGIRGALPKTAGREEKRKLRKDNVAIRGRAIIHFLPFSLSLIHLLCGPEDFCNRPSRGVSVVCGTPVETDGEK